MQTYCSRQPRFVIQMELAVWWRNCRWHFVLTTRIKMLLFSFLDYGGEKDTPLKPEYYLSYSDTTISFKWVIPTVLCTITNTGRVKSNTTLNVSLLRCFNHIAYLRNNMFRPFPRPSSGWSLIPFEATIQQAIFSLLFLTRSRFHR